MSSECHPDCGAEYRLERIGGHHDEFCPMHWQSRITQLEADLEEAQEVVVKLATHAGHYGNCPLSSWNKRLTKCACGLFQALSRLTPSPESSEAGQ